MAPVARSQRQSAAVSARTCGRACTDSARADVAVQRVEGQPAVRSRFSARGQVSVVTEKKVNTFYVTREMAPRAPSQASSRWESRAEGSAGVGVFRRGTSRITSGHVNHANYVTSRHTAAYVIALYHVT